MTLSSELTVFFTAMLPIIELRGAIPLGEILGLSRQATFFWAILGNMIPIFAILILLDPISTFLRKHSLFFEKFFTKLFKKTHIKHSKRYEEIGALLLITFVAIPLPGTGAWTGSLIAWLFKIPYWKAINLIFIGLLIAASIMTLGVTSFGALIELIR